MGCPWAGVLGQGECCSSSYSERVARGGGGGQRWCVGCRMLGLCVQGGGTGAVTLVQGWGA